MNACWRAACALTVLLAGCTPANAPTPAVAGASSAPVAGTLTPEPELVGRWRFEIAGYTPLGPDLTPGQRKPGGSMGEIEVTADGRYRWHDVSGPVEGALAAARPTWDYLDYKEWSYYKLRNASGEFLLSWDPGAGVARLHYTDGLLVTKGERL